MFVGICWWICDTGTTLNLDGSGSAGRSGAHFGDLTVTISARVN